MFLRREFALFIFFCLVISPWSSTGIEAAGETETGTVTGQIMKKSGGPLAGGLVFLFNEADGPPPSMSRYWTVPDHMTEIDKNGRFSIDVPEGKYYLGAIKRSGDEKIGPPQNGDLMMVSQDKDGKPQLHVVRKGEKTDIGIISEAVPFSNDLLARENITSIEGTISDLEGKPVEGAIVLAFTSQNMVGRPLFVTEKTGKDGRYLLRVQEGGKYFLRVRSNYGGGPPVAGDIMSSYSEDQPSSVIIKTGEAIKNKDIKVMKFPGRGPQQKLLLEGAEQQRGLQELKPQGMKPDGIPPPPMQR